jgi:hypothetical protein
MGSKSGGSEAHVEANFGESCLDEVERFESAH